MKEGTRQAWSRKQVWSKVAGRESDPGRQRQFHTHKCSRFARAHADTHPPAQSHRHGTAQASLTCRNWSKVYLGCSPVSARMRLWPCCCSAVTSAMMSSSVRAERCRAVAGFEVRAKWGSR